MEKKTVQASDLQQKIENGTPMLLLDVRDEAKYQSGSLHLKDIETINIPYLSMRDQEGRVEEQLASLPKETEIITLCTSGNKAQKAADFLREKGFTARPLQGGLTAWEEWNKKEQLP